MSSQEFVDDEMFDDDESIDEERLEDVSNRFLAQRNVFAQHEIEKSYMIRCGGAVSECEKEFEMFKFFVNCGGGRSINYTATVFNLQVTKLHKIAKQNFWAQRARDYDIDLLAQKLKLEQDTRAIEHKKRLEEYREQQEFIGRSLSVNAAKLAVLSQRTIDEYLENDRNVDIRDLPAILNSAAKLADVGKNLQSGALGVEQLLVALEEAEIDE